MPSTLLDLPTTLLEQIVLEIEQLRDVSALASTYARFRNLIYEPIDSRLWRTMYLKRYDDPRITRRLLRRPKIEIDWAKVLKERRQSISRIARSDKLRDAITLEPLEKEIEHLLDALQSAEPGYGPRPAVQMVLDAAHAQPTLTFSGRPRAAAQQWPHERTFDAFGEAICQLGTYFGIDRARYEVEQRHGARAFVYNLNIWRNNGWSPFDPATDKVEWQKVEALMLVACQNATELCNNSDDQPALPPCRLENARPFTQPGWQVDAGEDWAGVEGIWKRCINFLDWNMLFAYQRALQRGVAASVSDFFTRFDRPEAVHAHAWHLTVTDVVPNPSQPAHPNLHWVGEMVAAEMYAVPPRLRGVVRMTKHGDVKWTTITTFEGEDAYCSTGVQIGGVKAAFGVVGVWSGVHHEPGDPAGPNYMWRVDESEESLDSVSLD